MCVAGVDARLIHFLQQFRLRFILDSSGHLLLNIWSGFREFSVSLQTADVCRVCVCVCIAEDDSGRLRWLLTLFHHRSAVAPSEYAPSIKSPGKHQKIQKPKNGAGRDGQERRRVLQGKKTQFDKASHRHVKPTTKENKKNRKRRLRAVRCIIESHRDTRLMCICLSAFRMDLVEMGLP